LMASPTMILLDEPSMGLAPQIVEEIFEIVQDLNQRERVSFLVAEQNTNIALRYADYGYILENGRVMMDGEARELAENEDVKEFYLGVSSGERKSFRDTKFYRSEEHTSELQSRENLVCRLLLDPSTSDTHTLSLHDALPIFSTGRAEYEYCPALRRLRLHPGERAGHDGRRSPGAGRERRRQGVLPGRVERRAQEFPRHQVL